MSAISDVERLGWQRRAVTVLTELLVKAQRDELPALAWTVTPHGDLSGRCLGFGEQARRREWELWCAALGGRPRPERTDSAGVTHLAAVVERIDGMVDVVLFADLFVDDATEAGR